MLREVAIHMLLNRPVAQNDSHQVSRYEANLKWWGEEVANRLAKAGARTSEISEFKHLGNMATPNFVSEQIDRLEKIIKRLEGH